MQQAAARQRLLSVDRPYAADIPIADLAHAAIVQSTIANGRTATIDTAAAERAPGVFAVFTTATCRP